MALEPGSLTSVRQQVPLGLGHAIWCARAFIGDDPFAILLPDDLMLCDTPATKQLADAYRETGGNVVAIEEVPRDRVNRYGVLDVAEDTGPARFPSRAWSRSRRSRRRRPTSPSSAATC